MALWINRCRPATHPLLAGYADRSALMALVRIPERHRVVHQSCDFLHQHHIPDTCQGSDILRPARHSSYLMTALQRPPPAHSRRFLWSSEYAPSTVLQPLAGTPDQPGNDWPPSALTSFSPGSAPHRFSAAAPYLHLAGQSR